MSDLSAPTPSPVPTLSPVPSAAPAAAGQARGRSAMPLFIRLAVGFVALMITVALLAPVIAPHDYTAMDLKYRMTPPFHAWAHPLGTDELGRDVLSRLIVSIRVSLLIAFGATLISATLGTVLGFLSAHFRGWVEQAVLVLADFQAAMPFLILALAVLAFFGNALTLLVGLIGLYGWERYARIARGLAISASAQGYAAAVVQLGARPGRVYARHILPNIASTLIVSMTLVFPEVILLFFGNALTLLVGLIGLYGWERYARIARGLAISASAQGYAAAVVQLGARPGRVYARHILPNIASTLIVSMTLVFPEVILLESGLSFLGLGVQPPMTSLGNMVGFGRDYITRAPWIVLAPSAVIVLTTLSVSLIGDWLRDRLDPTLR